MTITLINRILADPAFSTAIAAAQCILLGVLVPVFAMSRQDSWTHSNMLFSGEWLEMLWIYAAPSLTQMMKVHAFGYRSSEKLKNESMSPARPVARGHQPVADFVATPGPEPTTGIRFWRNLLLQAFRKNQQIHV